MPAKWPFPQSSLSPTTLGFTTRSPTRAASLPPPSLEAYPAHVLELLAVVHALRVFRHYLLGSGAPRPPGVLSDFTIRTDNQAVTWLRTKRDVNRFLARWLDEIEEFRFDMEHVPGKLNPADPLSRRGLPKPAPPGSRPTETPEPRACCSPSLHGCGFIWLPPRSPRAERTRLHPTGRRSRAVSDR